MSSRHFDESFSSSAPQNYERYFVPAIGEPLAVDLLRVAALRPGERVLDVGCGTGIVTRLAAERVGPDGVVRGLDVNPGMLAVARSVTPPDAGIEWHEGSAESMPFPDETFDVVLCQMSLQFVEDRAGALREMWRVLVPGGRVALNLPGPTSPVFRVLADAMGRHISPEATGFVEVVFSLHDVDELRDLLASAGFREAEADADVRTLSLTAPGDFLWQYVYSTPLAGIVAGSEEDARAALETEVVEAWREFEGEDGLEFEQRIVVATGLK